MSKKEQTTEVQVISEQMPAFLRDQTAPARGMEDVTAADIIIPRVELIQALSPARDKKDPAYIDGAEEGMLFNNVTRALYGSEALVVPVVYRKQYLIWKDRKLGGGANGFRGAFNTPQEAAAHIATLNEEALDVIETAQHFCLVVNGMNVEEAVVSMSKTKLKVSKRWNSLMRLAGGDSFSRAYRLGASLETNARNEKYYNLSVTPAGYVNENIYRKAEALYNQIGQGNVVASHDYEDVVPAAAAGEEF